MAPFDLAAYLARTGLRLTKLATYLQVTPTYLEAVAAGQARLTARDQAKCRLLWRRLFQGKQLELPFAESPGTFTRRHARAVARAGATPAKKRAGGAAQATKSSRTPRRREKPEPSSSPTLIAGDD